jgi:hypothetical protein
MPAGPDPTSSADQPPMLSDSVRDLLGQWQTMALKASRRHSSACDNYEHRNALFGTLSTVLTAIVGSTIFVTLQHTTSEGVRIIFGLLAALAAVISGVQTTAKYGQLAERFRQASRRYATVARRIEELLATPPSPDGLEAALDELRKELDDIGAMAPNVPPKIWNKPDPSEQHRRFASHKAVSDALAPPAPSDPPPEESAGPRA